MRTQAAKTILAMTLSAAMIVTSATASFAKPRASVERVTKAYKVWLQEEGHDLTGRVRIVLKADQIIVHMSHEDGTTRLIFSPDGDTLLGEMSTQKSASADAGSCLLKFRCKSDRRDRSTTEVQLAKVDSPKPSATSEKEEQKDTEASGGKKEQPESKPEKPDNSGKGKAEDGEAVKETESGAEKSNSGKGKGASKEQRKAN